jgi:RNA polymerase sigma-70 factor, ECF subfamily
LSLSSRAGIEHKDQGVADETPSLQDARFARGERDAFEQVYARHAGSVRQWVRRFFKSPFEQEEAVQEVWLTAHRTCRQYQPSRGAVGPWLRALCANRCRELLRAASRQPPPGIPLEDVADALWLDAPLPDAVSQAVRLRAELERFAATLGAEEARVLQLCFVEQRGHAEVASTLGVDVRRAKYLRQKVLAAAAADARLMAVMREEAAP